MPQFFDIKNLMPMQKENWDFAVAQYDKVKVINVEKYFSSLTASEKKKLKSLYGVLDDVSLKIKINDASQVIYSNGGDKSALFARLLEGKSPLVMAPPTSFSYPWYSVIEDSEPVELTMFDDFLNAKDFVKNNKINIHQNDWKVLKINSKKESLVTFGEWEKLGFVWRFYLDKISCKKTIGFICAHHDKNLTRVTTLKELIKEQEFHVNNYFDTINLVLDEDYAKKKEIESIEKYGAGLGRNLFASRLQIGKLLLEERIKKGLPAYPSAKEVELEVKNNVQKYLDKDITVDNYGNLYSSTWFLQRIMPTQLGSEIYMKI